MRDLPGVPVPAHWIRRNEVSRLPRRWVTLDAEARRIPTATGETQTFRLAVVAFDAQDRRGAPWKPTGYHVERTTRALWERITGFCRAGRTTTLIAHNLGYDLRVTEAFDVLPLLGYRCDIVRLDPGSTWASWSGPQGTLKMLDTVSWFGAGVDALGRELGVPKLPLPRDDAPDDVWTARCRVDVDILRAAWFTVLDWLERSDLGTFKPSGPGQGWAAFRHRLMDVKLLHHGSSSIAEHEREAAWTGRCEAWRWGRLPRGVWSEWDHRNAYAMIARDNNVPVRLAGHVGPVGCRKAIAGDAEGATLVHATIEQAFPVAPARGEHGILWPIGRSAGWWWDVELQAVEALGGTVEAHEGWRYETGPALATWAGWVLDQLGRGETPDERVVGLVVKGWSRTLIGRFGSRWAEWDELGDSPHPGVWLGSLIDGDSGVSRRLLSLGGRALIEGDRHDAPDSCPQVMSYVMTLTRLRLLRAMLTAGVEHVAYVDTDGLLVDEAGSERLRGAGLPGLRVKGSYRSVEVLGPRQLVLEGKLRAAGVPGSARRVGRDTWSGEVWSSLRGDAHRGRLSSVTLTERTWCMRGRDNRRAHLPDGTTAAYRLG